MDKVGRSVSRSQGCRRIDGPLLSAFLASFGQLWVPWEFFVNFPIFPKSGKSWDFRLSNFQNDVPKLHIPGNLTTQHINDADAVYRNDRVSSTPMHAWYSPCMLGTTHACLVLPCMLGTPPPSADLQWLCHGLAAVPICNLIGRAPYCAEVCRKSLTDHPPQPQHPPPPQHPPQHPPQPQHPPPSPPARRALAC